MRPLWKGAISIGLIYVPIKLYSATGKKDYKLNYLHKVCKTPVKYQRHCPKCEINIDMGDIVHGYEYEKGKFVVFNGLDFVDLGNDDGKNIHIQDFVYQDDINPVYYDKAYYLAPTDGSIKVYDLLRSAMKQKGKAAIAKIIIRSRETIAAIRAIEDGMMLNTMFYDDEVRPVTMIPDMNYQVSHSDNEQKMAGDLIDSYTAEFFPGKYINIRNKQLSEIIQAKINGEEVVVDQKPHVDKASNLMEALRASIEKAKEERSVEGYALENKDPVRDNDVMIVGKNTRRKTS